MRLVLGFLALMPGVAKADSADGELVTLLAQCLVANQDFPENCQNLPYRNCLETQLTVAPNPELASERCWHQEIFVWGEIETQAKERLKRALPDEEWRAIELAMEARGNLTAEETAFPFLSVRNADRTVRPMLTRGVALSVRHRALLVLSYEELLRNGAFVFQGEADN